MIDSKKCNWKHVRLGDICTIARGSSPRPIMDDRYFKGGNIPWIKIADATESGKYLYKTKEYVNEYGASFSRLLPKGSLIIAASGVTLGYVQLLGIDGCIHDGWIYLRDIKDADIDFIYYLLKYKQDFFFSIAYGAAIQNVNTEILRKMEIELPPIEEQRKIGSILSGYDDLITKTVNQTCLLEKLAQAIFYEWFVKFRFPNSDNIEFVENAFGVKPKTWTLTSLAEIIENVKEKEASGDHLQNLVYVPIDCISKKSLLLQKGKQGKEAKSSLIRFRKYDILFGAMRSYFHKVTIAPFDGVTRTTCFVLRPKNHLFYSFCLMSLFQESTVQYASSRSKGSTIPYTIWENGFADMPILLPTEEPLQKFNEILKPIVEELTLSYSKLKILQEIKNCLLPKLISGQIDVNHVEAVIVSD